MTGPVRQDGDGASPGGAYRKVFQIPNETSYLASVREAVREAVAGGNFPHDHLNRLTLAVDESVTNIMEHAYEDDLEGELKIEIALETSESEFVAHLRDWGKTFDPTKVPPPDLKAHVQEGRKHGLGIFLVKRIMDEVTYSTQEDGMNELKLVKRAGPGAAGKSASESGKSAEDAAGDESDEKKSKKSKKSRKKKKRDKKAKKKGVAEESR